jgi:hypothetical protein
MKEIAIYCLGAGGDVTKRGSLPLTRYLIQEVKSWSIAC